MVLWSSHNKICVTSWYTISLKLRICSWKLHKLNNPLLLGGSTRLQCELLLKFQPYPSTGRMFPWIWARFPNDQSDNVDKNQYVNCQFIMCYILTYLAYMQILLSLVVCIHVHEVLYLYRFLQQSWFRFLHLETFSSSKTGRWKVAYWWL